MAQEAPKRLSQWLAEQPASVDAYPLGLSWRVPDETAAQSMLRLELLQSLAEGNREVRADRDAVGRLRGWLITLPVTGRVPIAVADARWLMANPDRDPVLLSGHTVVLPKRPGTVTVVKDDGRLCRVGHKSGYEAGAYLDACAAGDARADWVWIAQPDGRVQRFGVATWNREQQDEPAPGAWLWAPSRGSGWPERFSQRLIQFLATQGPALDEEPSSRRKPGSGEAVLDSGVRRNDDVDGVRRDDDLGGVRRDDEGGQAAGFPVSPLPSPPPQAGEGIVALPAGAEPTRSRGLEVSASDWGHVGLLQTPTARMREPGHFSFHLSRTEPYTHGNVFMQPFEWMEAGFRYTSVSNRTTELQQAFSGESYKDKGFDVKFRLWPESAYVPQIALGFRDIAGTGLFSGEYLVASKRTGYFDWSYGVGWGYLAGESRPRDIGSGGNFAFGSYFSGNARPFGGVQWQTPWERLLLKLEYDANTYQNEPLDNTQRHDSPWNFGLVYRLGRNADLSLGFERGNKLMLGLTLHSQFDKLTTAKVNDPPRVPIAATRPQKPPDWKATARDVTRQSDWEVRKIEQRGTELRVAIEDPEAVYWKERVDRAVGVLHRDAPQEIERFVFVYRNRGTEMAEHVVDRDAWVARHTQYLPPTERLETIVARAPERTVHPELVEGPVHPSTPHALRSGRTGDYSGRTGDYSGRTEGQVFETTKGPFEGGVRIGYGQTLGGPDAFALFQIYGEARGRLKLREDTWAQGAVRLRLIDNYDKFKFTAPSNLPRVRTFLREYLTTSDMTMPNLMLAHVGKVAENHYFSLYGGSLEEMFGGVGAEWLYRPFASRIALGVDVNEVKQRDFHQNFAFRDYRVTTGHATLYWETGWNDVLATVSAGRYLAGDIGATVNLSRTFKNGVTVGAFATKTNVSAEEFGEGSFDKGVYIAIPFDAMFSRTSGAVAYFQWKPLTRDGGAMLGRPLTLYNLTSARGKRALKTEPAPLPNEAVLPADRVEPWQPSSAGPEPYTRVTPKPERAQWREDSSYEYRLMEALQR
ncbi:MAG: YjbH domain-containing protein, partial [Betaproteobacteria bacterium]